LQLKSYEEGLQQRYPGKGIRAFIFRPTKGIVRIELRVPYLDNAGNGKILYIEKSFSTFLLRHARFGTLQQVFDYEIFSLAERLVKHYSLSNII
jgi:hypothetical protein